MGAGQWLTTGNPQLPFHQILTTDHFSDWVLNLEAGVHLHKEEFTLSIKQKLNRTGALIINGERRLNGSLTHLLTQGVSHARSRCFFDDFLVAALHRTVPLKQVNCIAMAITKHLNFHMPWLKQILLYEHNVVIKTIQRLALGRAQCLIKFPFSIHRTHALATTASRRF